MRTLVPAKSLLCLTLFLASSLSLPPVLGAQEFTTEFNRENCTFSTAGNNPYLPIWPGLALRLEGEEEDDGELVEISATTTILRETELVDGVLTRVVEERELEDGELVEVSRNFVAVCRETGDVWYFGEDVDDYEDGEIIGHEGAWRAGIDGATPGILMPGSPMIGQRYFQEVAPGAALDRGEIIAMEEEVTVPFGTFTDTLTVVDTDVLDPESENLKFYAKGLGNVVDEVLELVDVTLPPCLPDAKTHCLNQGRFRVEVEWKDEAGNEGKGEALLASDDSGEFWFFSPNNTEMLVKVLDACDLAGFNSFWVFAAGLTDVEVSLEVTDTFSGQSREYESDLNAPFDPVLDTSAFLTCDTEPPSGDDD
ncbi:MAG: hypothetical protein AAF657_25650 [Acidobacteriota bacterium]